MSRPTIVVIGVIALITAANPHPVSGQPANRPIIPEDASERYLLWQIDRLDAELHQGMPKLDSPRKKSAAEQVLLFFIDELLERYPDTTAKDRALILKLRTLADLARGNRDLLSQLLVLTEEIARGMPGGELASENSFYAIQAFVIAARYEDMPRDRRLHGAVERYQAFVEDNPDSPRVPVILASMIRDLLALDEFDRAVKALLSLQRGHPKHPATRRAKGEVNRARAVGRPFKRDLTTSDGRTIRSSDYADKVLVIHFWSSRGKLSTEQVRDLAALYSEYHHLGLELLSINVDVDRERAQRAADALKVPWRQYYEPKGLESDIVVNSGVIALPTFFVIDRAGILQSVDRGEHLSDLIKHLAADPKPKPACSDSNTP